MSNWGFVSLAFGLTWAVLAGYAVYLRGKARRAAEALQNALRQEQDNHTPVEVRL